MSDDGDSVGPVDNDSDGMITLKCGDDPRILKLDRAILTNHSKYFEGSSSFDTNEICFDEDIIPFDILELLVEFMLSEEGLNLNPTMDNIEQLFYAADYLQMDSALKILMDFLHADMATQKLLGIQKRVLLIYLRLCDIVSRYAKSHNYKYARQIFKGRIDTYTRDVKMSLFFARNLKKVLNEKPLLDLTYDDLVTILDSDDLDMAEADVIKVIKKWINYDFENRKIYFDNLLKCIRYNRDIDMKSVTEQLCCDCTAACDCLLSEDLVISLYALKNGCSASTSNLTKPNRARFQW